MTGATARLRLPSGRRGRGSKMAQLILVLAAIGLIGTILLTRRQAQGRRARVIRRRAYQLGKRARRGVQHPPFPSRALKPPRSRSARYRDKE